MSTLTRGKGCSMDTCGVQRAHYIHEGGPVQGVLDRTYCERKLLGASRSCPTCGSSKGAKHRQVMDALKDDPLSPSLLWPRSSEPKRKRHSTFLRTTRHSPSHTSGTRSTPLSQLPGSGTQSPKAWQQASEKSKCRVSRALASHHTTCVDSEPDKPGRQHMRHNPATQPPTLPLTRTCTNACCVPRRVPVLGATKCMPHRNLILTAAGSFLPKN